MRKPVSNERVAALLNDWVAVEQDPFSKSLIQSLQNSINESREAFDVRAQELFEFFPVQMITSVMNARIQGLGIKHAEKS